MLWNRQAKGRPPRGRVCPERNDKKRGVGRINRFGRNDIRSAYIIPMEIYICIADITELCDMPHGIKEEIENV